MIASDKAYFRTEEDVATILHHSNISSDNLEKSIQVLYFAYEMKPTLLLEIDSSLTQSITTGEMLKFVGKSNDKLILCSSDKTYGVKSAETSNSMLIIPGLELSKETKTDKASLIKRDICSTHHSYLEVRRIKPDIGKIKILLDKKPYLGPELEPVSYDPDNFFTTQDLLERVQISEAEALDVLLDLDALQVNGFWRILSFEYHFRALSHLINLIDENSWSISSIPMRETVSVLKELVPCYIAEHIFSTYCTSTGAIEDDEQIFELNGTKVSRFLAMALLSHAEKFDLNDFMVAWKQGVSEGLDVGLHMIRDMIIIEDKCDSTASISYFPEHNLSGNINERFKQLFKAKPMWNFEEIEPFLM